MGFANEQAAGYINLALYENSIELLGTAKVKLPDIPYLTTGIEGAGIMGKLNIFSHGNAGRRKSGISRKTSAGFAGGGGILGSPAGGCRLMG